MRYAPAPERGLPGAPVAGPSCAQPAHRRITSGSERKAARGEWLTGRRPYGYHLDTTAKTLTVHDDEAAVVQAIFAKYVDERLGATAIANWLNDTGRRTRYGNFWAGQAVLRLLRNPVYVGQIRHGDTVHDGKHDAILDRHLFDQAQALLDERAAESAVEQPTESEYLLSGLPAPPNGCPPTTSNAASSLRCSPPRPPLPTHLTEPLGAIDQSGPR
jgi:hypothetical protein